MATHTLPESYPAKIVLTNILTVDKADDTVWNTGKSAVGNPYCNEDFANAGKAIIEKPHNLLPAIKHGQTAVMIFGLRDQYLILDAGDTVTLTVETDEAAQYYLNQNSASLKVTLEGKDAGISEASDAESL